MKFNFPHVRTALTEMEGLDAIELVVGRRLQVGKPQHTKKRATGMVVLRGRSERRIRIFSQLFLEVAEREDLGSRSRKGSMPKKRRSERGTFIQEGEEAGGMFCPEK